MDRDALDHWLHAGHRTWRWRFDEDYDRYEALATSDEGLRWFLWSHLHGEDGQHDETVQTFERFEADGPLRKLPEQVERELRAWLAEHRG